MTQQESCPSPVRAPAGMANKRAFRVSSAVARVARPTGMATNAPTTAPPAAKSQRLSLAFFRRVSNSRFSWPFRIEISQGVEDFRETFAASR